MDALTKELVQLLTQQAPEVLDRVFGYVTQKGNEIDIELPHNNTLFAEMPDRDGKTYHQTDIKLVKRRVAYSCSCGKVGPEAVCEHVLALAADYISWDLDDAFTNDTMPPALPVIFMAKQGNLLKFLHQSNMEDEADDFDDSDLLAEEGSYKELNNGWIELRDKPEYLAHNFISGFNLKWPTAKDINSLEKVSVDERERYWVYRYKTGINKSEQIEWKYNGEKAFLYKCSCGKKPACKHVAAFLGKITDRNPHYFFQFKNFDEEKSTYLAQYGLSLSDPEASDFVFKVTNNGLTATAPSWAVKVTDTSAVFQLAKTIMPPQKAAALSRPALPKNEIIDFEVGFVLNFAGSKLGFLPFELEAVKVFAPKANGQLKINKLDTHVSQNWGLLKNLPDELYSLLISLSKPHMEQYADKQLGYGYQYLYGKWSNIPERIALKLLQYYQGQLRKIWPLLQGHPHFYVLVEGRFSPNNLLPVTAVMPFVSIQPKISMDERFITLELEANMGDDFQTDATALAKKVPAFNNDALQKFQGKFKDTWQWLYGFFYVSRAGHIALANTNDDQGWFQILQGGKKRFPVLQKEQVVKTLLPALEERLGKPLALPKELQVKRIPMTPMPRVLVKEYMEKYLMLLPQLKYNGKWVDYNRNDTEIWLSPGEILEEGIGEDEGIQTIIERDTNAEAAFYERLRSLHPTFARQLQNDFYYLPFDQVMKDQWFIKTLQELSEENIPVFGIEELKKFRYSALKPKWEMKAGSQTDWFDLKIEVKFGEEVIPLKTIRKAFATGQHVIMLNDGSLGMLPEEWLKQYGSLLKMGQEKEPGTIRLSKLHYTLIEALHEEIDDKQVLAELAEKKDRLKQIEKVKAIPLPQGIKGTLRPYQVSGFAWMNTLEQMGWGGCLADDMGLGKTLQTITFLQHLKEKYAGSTHLVVCPTSLLYNWENELRKFAPALKFWTHYGTIRALTEEEFAEHDIIITSYGLVRSDIELLKSFDWHYLILDESQAIKNPDALTTRALHLLKAKNRLILSGTPLQNNTYDLYAQFNFLNPGMLGSREFFREEFANAIDKYNDKAKAETLRRLLHPFMLRRTKAQVAPDLPEKTETILWCQMSKKQQQVYDEFKVQYRQALMKKIEEVGMAKAGMLIIEGLLRLRQICNSPLLLKNEDYAIAESIKVEELMREINENSGGHKLLVFSQFTGMLQLIAAQLQKEKIAYAYLDGSTTAQKRKEAVERFQHEKEVRVFLISLKAGGVGLNLTAADYVYLVDPWWNPAAEQQAIDRTHRIGQKQKIFAYKMICRNTVEEKILELQSRKRKLAGDLVGEDEAIAKNLTKEDVAYLFG